MSNECIPELNRICRLCGERSELISIFSVMYLDLSASLQDVIYETVSVKVEKDDCISRNICAKCMNMVVEIFKFRRQAIANDQLLKEQHTSANKRNEDVEIVANDQQNIFNNGLYKQIKLPNGTFKVFSNPFVVMDFGVVEDYFRKKKLDMKLHMVIARRNYRTAKRLEAENVQKRLSIQLREPTRQQQFSNNNIKISSDTFAVDKDSPIDSITVSSTYQSSSNDNQATSSTIDIISSTNFSSSFTSQQLSIDNNPVTNTKSFSNIMEFDTRCTTAHMCRICNKVFNKRCHLLRHLLSHLICQFCKEKCKTQKDKEKHISTECKVRNAISGASTLHVPLQKVEQDLKLVKMYYPAFTMFSEILPVDFKAQEEPEAEDSELEDPELFSLYIESDDQDQSKKEDLQDPINTIIKCNKEDVSIEHDDQELVNLIMKSFKESDSKENNLRLEGSSPHIDHFKEKQLLMETNITAIENNDNVDKDFKDETLKPFKLAHGPLKSTLVKNYNYSRIKIIKALLLASNTFKAKAKTDITTQTILVPDIKKVNQGTKFGPVLLDNALKTLTAHNIPVQIKSDKHVVISCKEEIASTPLKLEDWDHLPLNDMEVEENATVVTTENL